MAAPPPKVDRQATTPFLLKLYYRSGGFHRNDEFLPHSASPAPQHVQMYTWPNCSLRELTQTLVSALPSLLPSPAIGTRLAFRLIFPDTKNANGPPRFMSKDLGSVVVSAEHDPTSTEAPLGDLGTDADKTLQDARFVIGDYVSCAVFPPLPNGDVAGPPPPQPPGYGGYGSRGGRPPPRENGFGRGRDFRSREGDGLPSGEWRRGDVPPPAPANYGGRRGGGRFEGGREYGGGGGGGYGGGGHGRGRTRGRGGW